MLSSKKPYLEIAKDELNFQEQIGKGAQGAVYKALWKTNKQIVAVKHVFEFVPELKQLQRIQHKHIVHFFGAVEEELFKAIVLEYAEHGSLYDVIQSEPPDFEQLLIWSRHIALGLNYLHNGVSPPIIHRDLKSRNVVIASNRVAKICDFGSSRALERTYTHFSKLHGTMAWMAPEVLRGNIVSAKCDTYSFAVLLWELITCKIPFEGEEDPQIIYGVCKRQRRPPIPPSCPEKFAKLISDCWQDDAVKRPTIEDILLKLNAMLGDITLTEEVDRFLAARQEWEAAFEIQIEEIRDEFQAIEQQFRDQLSEKDMQIKNLENRSKVIAPSEDKGISSWKEIEVVQWLNHNLADISIDFSNEFFENNITGQRLLKLTEMDLMQMGITSLGHRKDILNAIIELKNRIQSIENYPPLMGPTSKTDKPSNKTSGTLFHLTITYGNSFYIGNKSKWNLFLYVEGDNIAIRSIKYVEFRITSNDTVKRERNPYVMEDFRYEKPKGPVECKVFFRGNVIRPKTWSQKFEVVCEVGGYSPSSEVEICLNENQVPSTIPSLTSSISSFSSFNVIDNWQTSPGPGIGAWSAGPPLSILRSPTLGIAPNYRRGSSPFSSSPQNSPNLNRRKAASGNNNHMLNHSSSSPAKMNQLHKQNSRDALNRDVTLTRDKKARYLPLSFQEDRALGSNHSDLTPTHDPRNPRFSSARSSLVDCTTVVDDLKNLKLRENTQDTINTTCGNISFGSMRTTDLNMNFASANNSHVEDTDEIFELEVATVSEDRGESTPKKKRGRGISISSTISGNSAHSVLEVSPRLGDNSIPNSEEPKFSLGVSPPSNSVNDTNWWDTPTWGVPSNTSSSMSSTPHPNGITRPSDVSQHGDTTQQDEIAPLTSTTNRTPVGYRIAQPTVTKPLDLASAGKLSYAEILLKSNSSNSTEHTITPPTSLSGQKSLPLTRSRKNSSGSNTSDSQRGGSRRRRRGTKSLSGRGHNTRRG